MKRFIRILAVLGTAFILWYFVIKPNDYNIRFKANTSVGHAYTELLNWGAVSTLPDTNSFRNKEPYHKLTQQVEMGAHLYEINWSISRLNDSVSTIKAGINEPGHRLLHRLTLPFSDTDYEKATLDLVLDYKSFLDQSIEQFTIAIEEIGESPQRFCACTRSRTTPEQKAFSMMRDYSYLSGFITSSGLTPQGRPLVEVTRFDEENRMLEFNFCFPVGRKEHLPESPDIFFRDIAGRPSVKATYHGDYRFSEKSWYRLYDYAEDHDLNYLKTPIEVYHNNPNMGGDALQWTTTIYLPFEKEQS